MHQIFDSHCNNILPHYSNIYHTVTTFYHTVTTFYHTVTTFYHTVTTFTTLLQHLPHCYNILPHCYNILPHCNNILPPLICMDYSSHLTARLTYDNIFFSSEYLCTFRSTQQTRFGLETFIYKQKNITIKPIFIDIVRSGLKVKVSALQPETLTYATTKCLHMILVLVGPRKRTL